MCWSLKYFVILGVASGVFCNPSAVDLAQDIYSSCLQHFSVSCVRPKALWWINNVADKDVIKVTEDLVIVKNENTNEAQVIHIQDC